MISVQINGKAREFAQPMRVSELIIELGLAGKKVALERNGDIVPRGTFDGQVIAHGDRLEIVVAVGGG